MFTYFPFEKDLEKQTKKQVDDLKFSSFSYKLHELKQIDSIFPKNS